MRKLPQLSTDLIDYLDEVFPERCPDLEQDEREIWFYAGARSVVKMLLAWRKSEQEDDLLSENQ